MGLPTVQTAWSVEGVALQNAFGAWGVETLSGRFSTAAIRGKDIMIPFRDGEQWKQKYAGPRKISLGMWITDLGSGDGTQYVLETDRASEFSRNYTLLRNLFWQGVAGVGTLADTLRPKLVTLSKTWIEATSEETTVSVTASAEAELINWAEPVMIGPYACKVVVDLNIPGGFFYDDDGTPYH